MFRWGKGGIKYMRYLGVITIPPFYFLLKYLIYSWKASELAALAALNFPAKM
jgi:hypothetical protein